MNSNKIDISIVTPMFNEEECVKEFCERVDLALRNCSYELIIVNDGSTDSTHDVLLKLSEQNKNIRYLQLARNRGQSYAVYCGFQHSCGKYVVMMDGDLQNLPEDILKLVDKSKQGFDLVSGLRADRKDQGSRTFLSKIANFLLRKVTGCEVKDMGGFKCLRGEIARSIQIRSGHHRLLPALVHMLGGSTAEVPVTHNQRIAGQSKYTTLSRTLDVIFDIIMLWFQNSSKARPLYFFGKISLLFFAFSIIIFGYLVFERQVNGIPMGSRPLFIIDALLLLTSFGSLAMALVTEQVADIKDGLSSHRPYVVRYDSLVKD